MKHNNLFVTTIMISFLFCITTYSIEAVDVTIIDGTGDVLSVDYFTQETTIVTYHPDINVDNLDIVQATYIQQGMNVTVSVQVTGNIENRGKMPDLNLSLIFNFAEYSFEVVTSEQIYTIAYVNQTGQIDDGIIRNNLTSSDFSVVGDTLSITYQLKSAGEIYETLSVASMFIKMNLSSVDEDLTDFVWLSDVAPNPPLSLYDASAETNNGFIGQSIQFNATIDPFTGTPPYTYHWDFGDGSTSTQLNPTHIYQYDRIFTYTFTVTDNSGATASKSGDITIIDNYQSKRAFLFGRYQNLIVEGKYITVEAVNLRIISFHPFRFFHYASGETIRFANHHNGRIFVNGFLIGSFDVVL